MPRILSQHQPTMTPRRKPEASSENAVVVAHHIPTVYNKELALDAPTKSPIKRVVDGRITKARKEQILLNLETELNERIRKLRAQAQTLSQSLAVRIGSRINRVPKKFWNMTMGELLAATEGEAGKALGDISVRGFVNDIRRLSNGAPQSPHKLDSLATLKKRQQKTFSASNPSYPHTSPQKSPQKNPLILTNKSNFPPSGTPLRAASPQRSTSPTKLSKPAGTGARKRAPGSRPQSRANGRTSVETAGTVVSTKGGMKDKEMKRPGTAKSDKGGNKEKKMMGQQKSDGSLKENKKVGGEKTSRGGRVLRSRK
ncbi:hypothetical protein BZA77DRAFT_165590 [Pyronema omphalodes]|nr:hypothetical protein BZA77DRAFT_165590 [Pyronema omphalodes]